MAHATFCFTINDTRELLLLARSLCQLLHGMSDLLHPAFLIFEILGYFFERDILESFVNIFGPDSLLSLLLATARDWT